MKNRYLLILLLLLLLIIFFAGCSGNYGITMFTPTDWIIIPFKYIIITLIVSFGFYLLDDFNTNESIEYKWYFLKAFFFTPALYTIYRIFKFILS